MVMRKEEIEFSYNQILVFDRSVVLPGCIWSDDHVKQGFARRESVVCFGTILEFGKAFLSVYMKSYSSDLDPERVIAVPFLAPTGKVLIEGPEESGTNRCVEIEPGCYWVTAAQKVVDEIEEIELFFEKVEVLGDHSRIILADEDLDPPEKLVETSEVAEV